MVAVDDVLGSNPFLAGLQSDGNSVLVAAADQSDFAAVETKVTCIYVGRHIHTGQMADMDGPVGVGQSCCDEGSFMFHQLYVVRGVVGLRSFKGQI